MQEQIIQRIFEAKALQYPQHIAVEEPGQRLTYHVLNSDANRLASLLNSLGVKRDVIVNVLCPLNTRLVTTMLAVFKAGGIYLPMDKGFSLKRMQQIFEQTFHGILVIDEGLLALGNELLQELGVRCDHLLVLGQDGSVRCIKEDGRAEVISLARYDATDPGTANEPDDAAYIYYTSGSTGEGKAILGCHKSLCNYIHWVADEFDIRPGHRISHLSQVTFDASLKDLFMALAAGATVMIPPLTARENVFHLLDWIDGSGITVMQCVPSVFRLMLKHLAMSEGSYHFQALKHIMLDGEVLYARDVQQWVSLVGEHTELVNLYGTTESTILDTFHRIREIPANPAQVMHVGKPIANTFVAIINNGRLCRIGETGEIYIKTPFLTKGYYGNPALTAAAFVQNPLVQDTVDIVYRTGDIGRYLKDRSVEVLGRKDQQVKINGIRIELNEIEQAVLMQQGVRETVIKPYAKEEGEQAALICYYTASDGLQPERLKEGLKAVLNQNMIPSYFIRLEAFPLNINGKIDKKALPLPASLLADEAYEPFEGNTELQLAAIWEDILGHRRFGRSTSFFQVGGQSLKAIQLVSRVYRQFSVELRIRDIFACPAIREMALLVNGTDKENYDRIRPVEEQERYLASEAQKRLWILCQSEEGNAAYHIRGVFVFEGQLHLPSLQKALAEVVARHESLRTNIIEIDGILYQQVRTPENVDLSIRENGENKPFNIAADTLLRMTIATMAPDRSTLTLTIHHIIADAWSIRILFREILLAYNRAAGKDNVPVQAALPIQYRDYTVWLRQLQSSTAFNADRDYWLQMFKAPPPVLTLPADFQRPPVRTYNGKRIRILLQDTLRKELNTFAAQQGATLFMLLLSAVKTLCYRYTGQQDLVTGTTIAGRDHYDLEAQIGFYVNMLPLRIAIEENDSFTALLSKVKSRVLEAYEHKMYPFERLVEELQLERDMSHSPLFGILVELLNVDVELGETQEMEQVEVSYREPVHTVSKFDLTFSFREAAEGIILSIEYNTDFYKDERIQQLSAHFTQLLNAIVSRPDHCLDQLGYMADEETARLLAFGGNAVITAAPGSLISLFEEQAQRAPDAPAVVCGSETITYRELNAKANRLADFLKNEWGVRPGQLVAIIAARSVHMAAGIWGILKAGAGFIPIDPAYPAEWVEQVLRDTTAVGLLTETDRLLEVPAAFNGHIFTFDLQLDALEPVEGTYTAIQPDDLAYVLYTSGSTGRPKGVVITHGNLLNYILWANSYYFAEARSHVFGLFTSLTFDLSMTAFFSTLLRGDKLVLFAEEDTDQCLLQAFGGVQGVDTLKLTPSHIRMLAHLPLERTPVSKIILGGEALEAEQVNILQRLNPLMRIYNEYGPTETTVGCTVKLVAGPDDISIIGVPAANAHIYVVDRQMNLLPAGFPGELCVGGPGVALGYLNRVALTAERFAPNPFHSGRIYHTGDTAQWTEQGELVFIGRMDEQIKLRGHRIEPGEITAQLLQYEGVHGAVVMVRKNAAGMDHLAAWYTAAKEISPGVLRKFLAARLPNYMVPACFVHLNVFPLTINGKIDLRALPDPGNMDEGSQFVAPRNHTEETLAGIWSEVLGIRTIGIYNNFFDLGGHSLTATQVVYRMHKVFGAVIQLKDLFTHPTIEGLAIWLDSQAKASFEAIVPVEEQDYYAVSHAQKRMWILSQLDEELSAYNIPGAYVLEGMLNISILQKAFNSLIKRHHSLRTAFVTIQGLPFQRVGEAGDVLCEISHIDLRLHPGKKAEALRLATAATAAAFDLEKPPLWNVRLLQMEDEQYVLLFNMHHIISDGWSMDVLIRELLQAYNAWLQGAYAEPAPLAIQYKDFSAWQHRQLSGELLDKHRAYWLQQFKAEIPVLALPTDHPRPSIKTSRGSNLHTFLGTAVSDDLRQLSQQQGASLFMTLLASLNLLFYKYTRQEDIVIGTPVAGREHLDLEGQIGLYVNTLAIRNCFEGGAPCINMLQQVRKQVLQAFEHQVYPFDRLVDELPLERDMSRSPLFDVMLVVHYPRNDAEHEQGLQNVQVEGFERESVVSKFDLQFTFGILEKDIYLNIDYNIDLFEPWRINAMLGHYKQLLKGMTASPVSTPDELSLLAAEEEQQLLSLGSGSRFDLPSGAAIHTLIEEQALRTPDHAALRCGSTSFTYRELNERANRLASYLLANNKVRPEEPLGLMTGRSEWMLIGMLAILKTGAAYLPLDPAYPAARIAYIQQDAALKVALVENEELAATLGNRSVDVILLEQLELDDSSAENPGIAVAEEQMAYVIYTSGSTGYPKGVVITHANAVAFLYWAQREFDSTGFDICYAVTSYCFDLSVFELFYPLTVGRTVRILGSGLDIQNWLQQDVSVLINTVPSVVRALLSAGVDWRNVKALNMAGEPIPAYFKEALENSIPEVRNLYGPSEYTTYSTCYRFSSADEVISIGRPVSNTRIYILDERLQLLPAGVPGELCIAGEGIARGYLNRPDLTGERFVKDPYQERGKLYRTGDYARWKRDGSLELLGRKDNQVKLRGYRIELEEIEQVLYRHPAVKEALVMVREEETGAKYLAAYCIPETAVEPHILRTYLEGLLPAYMVPAHFTWIAQFPLTPNGKIDRSLLPSPTAQDTAAAHVAPRSAEEKALAGIWQEVLGIEAGATDNFFMNGGDSIKALQIASRAYQQGYKLEVKQILQHPVFEKLALLMSPLKVKQEEGEIKGELPMTPIQLAFFQDARNRYQHHYNQAVMFFAEDGFDEQVINGALSYIWQHHDMLRARFPYSNGYRQQWVDAPGQPLTCRLYDLRNEAGALELMEQEATMLQQGINLENGPLFKAALFRLKDGDRLLLIAHHLIIDGVSWRILFEDLGYLYQALSTGKENITLPLKTSSFKEWAIKLSAYANTAVFLEEALYWREMQQKKVQALPKDMAAGRNLRKDTDIERFTVSEELTALLLTKVNRAFGTEINDILLTALCLGFETSFGGAAPLAIALEGHGRETLFEELEISRTLGWFTSIYPVVFPSIAQLGPSRQIREVKEHLRGIPRKGIGYGIFKYLTDPQHKTGIAWEQPGPEIVFNYLGQFDADVRKTTFQLAGEPAGPVISPEATREYILEISGAINSGCLNLSIAYSREQYHRSTIAALACAWKEALEAVIRYCAAQSRPVLTPSDLSWQQLSVDETEMLAQRYVFEDVYPLSPMQEGLYFHTLMDRNDAYFEQLSYSIQGELDMELVRESLDLLFRRHDILRTAFIHEGFERPLQVVLRQRRPGIRFEDLSGKDASATQAVINAYKEKDKQDSFDLARDPLLRLAVWKLGPARFECVWSYHHVVLDGWCMSVLFAEYFEIYTALLHRRPYRLAPVTPYKEYIKWLQGRDKAGAKTYWENYLQGYTAVSGIPKKHTHNKKYQQEAHYYELSESLTLQLKQLAGRHQVTLNTLIQALWGVLLSKYNGNRDVVFGEVVSGRPADISGIETMIGLFINTIPVRVTYGPGMSFLQLLQELQSEALSAGEHHYYPLVDIQAASGMKQPLFDHILMLGNYPVLQPIDNGTVRQQENELTVSGVQIFEQVNYDLNIGIGIGEKTLIKFNSNAAAYDAAFLHDLMEHLKHLALQAISDANTPIDQLSLLNESAERRILEDWNKTSTPYPAHSTISSLFEQQVALGPEAIAVVYRGEVLTYSMLNDEANRLAFYLRDSCGIGREDRVGMLVDRSERMIIGILAILKAGAAYVPVDPAYPRERIAFMLADASVKMLLTDSEWMFDVTDHYQGPLFAMDLQLKELPVPGAVLPQQGAPEDLAYIMYTSGSTGKPKGVAVTQRNVVRLVKHTNYTDLQAGHRVLQLSNYAFDGAVFDIFGALLNGAGLYLIDKTVILSNDQLVGFINRHDINTLFITTALFNSIVELSPECIHRFNKLYFGGEEASLAHIRKALAHRRHDTAIVHVYGPTESTTFSTYYEIKALPEDSLSVPIGRPLANTTAYIVDEQMNPVPPGVIGEICLGGDGLARGYWQHEQLTAEKFVPHPFSSSPGERIYRTGDLGRWLPDGNIEFKGRKDTQVKIRGHRVELGEIENMLLKYEGMEQVHLMVRKNEEEEKQLVAYYTGQVPDMAGLRDYLAFYLPAYMIPAAFVPLQALPLNSNGKVDQQALPAPGASEAGKAYVPPATTLESTLADIWEKILKQPGIGVKDNFFLCGGDSIRAIRLVSMINKELPYVVEVKDIFLYPDIASLAAYLEGQPSAGQKEELEKAAAEIRDWKEALLSDPVLKAKLPADWEDCFPMSDIQKGMLYYTVHAGAASDAIYHDQLYHQVEDPAFSFALFKRAFGMLVEKHALLRTSFNMFDYPEAIQVVHHYDPEQPDITMKDLSGLSLREQRQYLQNFCAEDRDQPFNVQQCGLWRLRVFKLNGKDYGILLIIHHAIIDGWSEASLRTELGNVYYKLRADRSYQLPPLNASYKDYVIAQRYYKNTGAFASFWEQELAGYERTALPLSKTADHTAHQAMQYVGAIEPEITGPLLQLAEELGVHIKVLYLAAFSYLVRVTAASPDITIGLVSNGRPEIEDGDKIIGCFLNTVPFRILMSGGESVKELVQRVNEKYNRLKQYDKMPLHDIVKVIGEPTTMGNPVFDLLFNYLDLHITAEAHEAVQVRQGIISSFVNTNTWFDFTVNRAGRHFNVHIIYKEPMYSKQELDQLMEYYRNILRAMSKAATVLQPALMMGDLEAERLLSGFNNTATDYPRDKAIHQLFAETAARYPAKLALIGEDLQLSYSGLNARANRLAHYLREQLGAGEGDLIGIAMPRSAEMIVCLLAVLKAGAAYLPVDTGYPEARIREMLDSASLKACLCYTGQLPAGMDRNTFRFIDLEQAEQEIAAYPDGDLPIVNTSDSLAYLMYTSGSTGLPKGVMVRHKSVVRLVRDTNYVRLGPEDRLLLTGALSFDATTFEIWGMLLNGGELHVMPQERLMQPHFLKERIAGSAITVMWFTASWFNELADQDLSVFKPLSTLLAGGDKLSPAHINKLRKTYPHIKVINGYGPTENTTFSICHAIDREYAVTVPIGRPISNSTVYILDEDRQLAPIGVPGEIYLGGDGLAAGYWQQPALTAERFVPHPFSTAAGEKLYRTGDYGRWQEDGTVVFLGRKDGQVKIRGFRIELAEIEFVIKQLVTLEKLMVLVREDDHQDKQLAAYYTAAEEIDLQALRAQLRARLPQYMIPSAFTRLAAFPLTPNGKTDLQQLISMGSGASQARVHIAPRNETEQQITLIWEEILEHRPVGVQDNFFEIGGHSLKASRMLARIHKTLNVEISVRTLFANPTIETLALEVAAAGWAAASMATTEEGSEGDIVL